MELNGRPRLVKLVRDDVGQFLAATDGSCDVFYAPIEDQALAREHLHRKLVEEAMEYVLRPSIGELADIYEVLKALAPLDLGSSIDMVVREAQWKAQERGGFRGLVGMYCRTTAPSRHER